MVLKQDWRGQPESVKCPIICFAVSSHVDCLKSEEVFLGCLSDIGLGLWGLYLRNVEFGLDGLRER